MSTCNDILSILVHLRGDIWSIGFPPSGCCCTMSCNYNLVMDNRKSIQDLIIKLLLKNNCGWLRDWNQIFSVSVCNYFVIQFQFRTTLTRSIVSSIEICPILIIRPMWSCITFNSVSDFNFLRYWQMIHLHIFLLIQFYINVSPTSTHHFVVINFQHGFSTVVSFILINYFETGDVL